jgi:predicted CoA-binding protein
VAIEQEVLRSYKTIAVVGLSSVPSKPSHYVSAYMLAHGYRIIPVNPDEQEVLGLKSYPSLQAVPEPVEIVDVFRRPAACPEVARDAAAIGAKVLWLQQGITSQESRQIAEAAGMTYIEDACVMVEHRSV